MCAKKSTAASEETDKANADKKANPVATEKAPKSGLHVVGLGSSAGGLETLQEFFKNLPPDTGMAYVVVSHLHPGHVSLLPELLGKQTTLPVVEATDGVALKANHVYVSPPGAHLGVMNNRLQLMEGPPCEIPPLPIDFFFRSLAADQQEKAICIVLSGTGTDGTLGLRAIKDEGGLVMVQDVESARFAGMPSSAIATTLVDFILPAAAMPQQLVGYAQDVVRHRSAFKTTDPEQIMADPLQKIFMLLRTRTGHDFSGYKQKSIARRIERRMAVHHTESPDQYVRYLQTYPHEIDLLFRDMLIGVTNFFRDPEAFERLRETDLPELLKALPDGYVFRVWVPGCSSGEEAYTMAIVLQECIKRLAKPIEFQIFATDLNANAIEYARVGTYPEGIAADVPEELLKRYFVHDEGIYRVEREIRERIVFAQQSLIKDPPFTKLDMISCRNLLIYLNTELQKRILPVFHYALNPNSILLLGPSESVGQFADLFEIVDRKWKVFRRLDAPETHPLPQFPVQTARLEPQLTHRQHHEIKRAPQATHFQTLLLKHFAPASLVVNARGDIVYVHGRTGDYLEPRAGQPRMNIHDLARDDLALALGSSMRQAVTQEHAVVRERVQVKPGGTEYIDLVVQAITEPEAIRGLLLISFRPIPESEPKPEQKKYQSRKGADETSVEHMQYLEREVLHTREALHITVTELETANEELKSSNEELQSANEELQSTNEEMETSKEELQSLNEELNTVNAELQGKLDELSHANDDMLNLLNSTNIATIFLDNELNIKRYTMQARTLINLIPTDVGRPIVDLVSTLEYDTLAQDAYQVLQTLVYIEKEIRAQNGKWYLLRIMPYRTVGNMIEGLTLTFVEIIATQSGQAESRDIIQYLKSLFNTIDQPTLLLDDELRVVVANKNFYKTFKADAQKTEGELIYRIGKGQWNVAEFRRLLEEIIPQKTVIEDYLVKADFPLIGKHSFLLNARKLEHKAGAPGMVLLTVREKNEEG